jgi:hypothetical protein
MRLKLPSIAVAAATLLLIPATACSLDVDDLNNPGLDELEQNPTRVTVGAACTGLIVGSRRNVAQANGYIAQLGILGREAYNFDQADPRFFGELLEGPLQPGSPFGGNFWTAPYANVRLANIVERVAEKVPDYSLAEINAVTGFAKTIEATDLLEVVNTRDTNGGVIDTDHEITEPLGAIVGRDAMLAEIGRLLDEGAADLAKGGDGFPFGLSKGYGDHGLDSVSGFLKFNRAIRARVAVYAKDYAAASTALAGSFIKEGNGTGGVDPLTVGDLNIGAYHSYSTSPGDQQNALINPNIFAHPSFPTGAQMNGMNRDERVARKSLAVADEDGGSARGLSSNIKYTIYPTNSSPVAIIRNEELLLLRAEARFFMGDVPNAVADLNRVRTASGGLAPIVGTPDQATFITALLYERRYSLAFEGHRLIDVRRFGRVTDLPLDMPEGDDPPVHVRNVRYPIPQAECDARKSEPACMLGSMNPT